MSTHVAISVDGIEDRVAMRELIEAYAHCADHRDVKGQMAPDRCRRKCPYRILCDGSTKGTGNEQPIHRGTASTLPATSRSHDVWTGGTTGGTIDESLGDQEPVRA